MKKPNDEGIWRRFSRVMQFVAVAAILVAVAIQGMRAQQVKQPWVAPEAASKVHNPVKATPEGLKHAAELYRQNCVICHGKTGAADGTAAGSLPQKPANFTDEKMMKNSTDGELFWKMSTGRAPMPSWQDRIPEMERWELVVYLRDLTKRGQYKFLGTGRAE